MTTFLLAANLLAWIGPVFLLRGDARIFVGVLAFAFSASYWTYSLAHEWLGADYSGNVVQKYVSQALGYSILAALAFHLGLSGIWRREIVIPGVRSVGARKFPIGTRRFPGADVAISAIGLFEFLIFLLALRDRGKYGRIEFLDLVRPVWFTQGLPINMLAVCLLIMGATVWRVRASQLRAIRGVAAFHCFLVGFDGSRRLALLPILALAGSGILRAQMGERRVAKSLIRTAVVCALISTILTVGRNGNVGWSVSGAHIGRSARGVAGTLIAPMPTLHVNTEMIEYTKVNGVHGVGSYVAAVGNTVTPQFLVGRYLFGDPLVTQIHRELGWYGQDFGFMAHAIYAGGLAGVFGAHLIFGLAVAAALSSANRSMRWAVAVLVGLLFGTLNSLRSDAMNLLKASFYPAVLIGFLMAVTKVRLSARSDRRASGAASSLGEASGSVSNSVKEFNVMRRPHFTKQT